MSELMVRAREEYEQAADYCRQLSVAHGISFLTIVRDRPGINCTEMAIALSPEGMYTNALQSVASKLAHRFRRLGVLRIEVGPKNTRCYYLDDERTERILRVLEEGGDYD